MDNRTHAKDHEEILKRLEDLEKENERLRTLVDSTRAILVRYHIETRYNVWHYYLGGAAILKITEVFNPPDHEEKYGKFRYPIHGFQIERLGYRSSYLHPDTVEHIDSPCFLSLCDAETFVRGFFNGNPDMCVIVDAPPNKTIEDN